MSGLWVRRTWWIGLGFLLASALLVPAAEADPAPAGGWGWDVFTYGNDLWLRSSYGGRGQFDFRLGGGGAVAEFRDVAANFRRLLSPSFRGERTDRVFQWTAWSDTVRSPLPGRPPDDARFNLTQSGNSAGAFSPAHEVLVDRRAGRVDVYAAPQNLFAPAQDAAMQCRIACLTRYELLDGGVLRVRRVLRVGAARLHGRPTDFEHFYLEGWSPFDRSAETFDALALSLDGAGRPKWWYRAGYNLPYYPAWKAEQSSGYAVVFHSKRPETGVAVGVVYGTRPALPEGRGHSHVLNAMDWDNGIGVLPAVTMSRVRAGTVVDVTLMLAPLRGLNADAARFLAAVAAQVPAPAVYDPGAELPADLREAVRNLAEVPAKPGQRTEHLADLLSPAQLLDLRR
jgi:hypothetical protein